MQDMQALLNYLFFSAFLCICSYKSPCKSCKELLMLASLARSFLIKCQRYALLINNLRVACMSCMRLRTFFIFSAN